jgi:multidrug efflux pump subunit AcrA (membrane-fusion protein)
MAATVEQPQANPLVIEDGLIPDQPPHWTIWLVSWLFIVFFLGAALGAVFFPFPEIVKCPYVLTIDGGSDPIQAPGPGIVRKVCVTEGQRVAAGDELYIISSDEARSWDTEMKNLVQDVKTKQSDLTRDDLSDASEISVKDREAAQTQDEIKYRENYVATIRALVDRLNALLASGAISKEELITHQLELATGEKDLSLAKKSLEQVTLQRQEMVVQHERRDADAVAELEKLQVRIKALQDQMQYSQSNLRSVRAPYDGVVVSLATRNEGTVVQGGQELCQLAQPGAHLHARLQLDEPGIPRVAIGDKVRFFAEAFPYQRYGTITGKLEWLSPVAITSSAGEQFVAYASLDRKAFLVEGKEHPLQAGMKGDAHVIVGTRTLLEYAFEPIRQLREDTRP